LNNTFKLLIKEYARVGWLFDDMAAICYFYEFYHFAACSFRAQIMLTFIT